MEEESEQHRIVLADQGIPNCTLENDISFLYEGKKVCLLKYVKHEQGPNGRSKSELWEKGRREEESTLT